MYSYQYSLDAITSNNNDELPVTVVFLSLPVDQLVFHQIHPVCTILYVLKESIMFV